MNNKTKIYILILVVLIATISILLVGRFSKTASTAQQELDKERYDRITAEETLEKANTKISSLESEISRTQSKINALEKNLDQTKSINNDLKTRLDKAMDIKENLDKTIVELQQLTAPAAGVDPSTATSDKTQ